MTKIHVSPNRHTMVLRDEIKLATRLADAAGAIIKPYFRAQPETERKADSSPVSVADREAEAEMRRILSAEMPQDSIIGEEFGFSKGQSDRTWVLDPIDGTTAFLAGRPLFGTLIALLADGWPVLGVIDQPISGERWIGVTGQPSTFNGSEISTRRCRELANATLATTGPHYFDDQQGALFMALAGKTDHRRMVMGGDCYNYGALASGHIDIVCEAGLKLHDWAALVPVIEGAGGMMCDWHGDPLGPDSAGDVIALGDPARLEDVLEAMGAPYQMR